MDNDRWLGRTIFVVDRGFLSDDGQVFEKGERKDEVENSRGRKDNELQMERFDGG